MSDVHASAGSALVPGRERLPAVANAAGHTRGLEDNRSPEAILASCSRSFHLASRFLPRGVRTDVAILYAFCRTVDDAADEPTSAGGDERAVLKALEQLEAEVSGAAAARPMVAAFREMAARRGLDLAHARELIQGVRTDVGAVIIADDRGLHRYCYRVASTVGLMMCPLLGVRSAEAAPFAIDLGIAMQLTNICRDVREDAERGRVYLPRTRLERAGLSPEQLLSGEVTATEQRRAVARVVRDLLGMADEYYASAAAGMGYIPFGARLAIAVASRVYRAIGVKLAARGADPFAGRVVVGPLGKGWAALIGGLGLLVPWGWRRRAHVLELHRHIGDLPSAHAADLIGSSDVRAPLGLLRP